MNKIKYLSFTIFCLVCMTMNVYAASLAVKVTSTTLTLGNSVTVTTTFSSKKPIFFTEGTLKCSGAGVNGSLSLTFDNTSNDVYSKSFSYKVKPTTTGTVTCTTTATKLIDAASDNWQTIANKTIKITVNPQPVVVPKEKSSNNYLSSLSIDKYSLDKKFDKEVLEYSATLEPGIEKIKINAQLADSSASITGTGEKNVSTGLNNFKIVVTAENGSKKTYTLKVTVKDYDPINVTVNNEEYTVVRKRKDLPEISEYFEEVTVTIDSEEVDGYYNKTLDYTLVGLKSTDGIVNYYFKEDDKYTLYKEYTFNGITLNPTNKKVVGEVKESNFEYNEEVINAYQNVKLDIIKNTYALENNDITGNQFYLFYARNLDTGKEELYQYDAIDKTIQRYNLELLNMYKERSDTYYEIILYGILLLGIIIIIFSIITIKMGQTNKKLNKKIKKISLVTDKKEQTYKKITKKSKSKKDNKYHGEEDL